MRTIKITKRDIKARKGAYEFKDGNFWRLKTEYWRKRFLMADKRAKKYMESSNFFERMYRLFESDSAGWYDLFVQAFKNEIKTVTKYKDADLKRIYWKRLFWLLASLVGVYLIFK